MLPVSFEQFGYFQNGLHNFKKSNMTYNFDYSYVFD